MTIDKITVTYEVKRSKNYQSAGVSMSITATPREGESIEEVKRLCLEAMMDTVEGEADEAIREALRLDAML